jgi:hypothetical protein
VSREAGTIDESLRPFTARERRIAVVLAAEGKAVQAILESLIPGERSADAWVEADSSCEFSRETENCVKLVG